jgi:ABC-type nitrate/sulfonate/bicarbonate transport system substrate-binding protein
MQLNNFGVPPYPELIVFAREDFLARDPETARQFLRAVTRGYEDAIAKPDLACAAMAARVEGETAEGLRPYLQALIPVLQADAPAYGWLNLPILKDYMAWTKEIGVLDLREDPAKFATNEFLPPLPGSQGGKP